MLLFLPFNYFVAPLVLTCVVVLVALGFWDKVRRESLRAAKEKHLSGLKPPRKGQNHRSLPPKQYYLSRTMTKPTAEDEHLLEVYIKLYPEEARQPQPR